jgi:ribosomal protein S18 acetylase RimI-like enzyme
MSQSIFNDEYDDAKSMIESSFASEARVQYIGIFDNNPVGSATIFSDREQATIYALGILPEYQGKGLGKEFLSLLLRELLKNKDNINLEVNSVNARAFNLYKSMNFKVEIAYDYYRKSSGGFYGS